MKKPIEVRENGWSEIAGIQSPQIIRHFMGINSLDPFSIEEHLMVRNKNISTKRYPAAAVREGFSNVGAVTGETHGIGAWKGKEVNAISGGVWRKWTGAAWTQLLTGLNASAKWSFANFKGNFADVSLIAANGKDPVKVYDGTTVSNLANAPAGMNYVVGHENRLYGAVKNTLHYSALRKATDWNTVNEAGQIVIENNGGEEISSLVNGTGKIVIFLPHSTHELYGTGPQNYHVQLISGEIGCVADQSAVMVGGILFFLSHDGIYRYTGGATPRKDFSLPIHSYVERVNINAWDKVVAGTDGERYYISLPLDGATVPTITLEYDPTFQTWNIWDLGFTPGIFGRANEVMYIGGLDARVAKMGGTTNNGSAIPFLMETKPFSYDSLAADNRLYSLWVIADVPVGATLSVSLSNEAHGDTFTLVRTINGSNGVKATKFMIPVNQSVFDKWVRIKLEGTGPVTIHEITRQSRTFRMGIGGG